MKYWQYKPLGWLFGGISRLPFGMLYVLSDILFVLLYHVVGYRRKVALKNIADSFPDKSPEEHKAICRQFFRNFADYFFETIKMNHITDDEMRRHTVIEGVEQIDRYVEQGRSVAVYFSHCGNWEWGTSITLWARNNPTNGVVYAQVYRPLTNKWFDAYFLKLRSRFGSVSFDKRMVFRDLLQLKRDGVLSVTGFMSDQKPSAGDVTHVVKFLNHPTAMITGTETIVRRLNLVAFYWDVEKPSRGHYKLTLRLITDNPDSMPQFAITDVYARLLQQTIERNPSIWLWTHKRWKYPVQYPSTDEHCD
ncbi:lysophospholipid acyltransferase family protein [uncultured Muribaculum sp.]|uniref:lysophospholipid acyltransferase family protein n=1 Tax=uncultured Muribaculum sp. TaxID=1918613 RepID=UPI00264A1938|nr:acetyltransferase [uncultured Muribaculum sp.]